MGYDCIAQAAVDAAQEEGAGMIVNQSELAVGSKVNYSPPHYGADRFENGIVKEIPEHTTESVRVVYNCNGEWHRYQDFTSALTSLADLHHGWRESRSLSSGDLREFMADQKLAELKQQVTQWKIGIENGIRAAIISIESGEDDEAVSTLKQILGEG